MAAPEYRLYERGESIILIIKSKETCISPVTQYALHLCQTEFYFIGRWRNSKWVNDIDNKPRTRIHISQTPESIHTYSLFFSPFFPVKTKATINIVNVYRQKERERGKESF